MATIANNALDEDPVVDGDNSFIGGQVSASSEISIPKECFVTGINVDFDSFGRLRTRRGAKSIVGNVETRNWEDITTNWENLTSYWGNTLGSTAIDACFYFDTYAAEYVVIAQGGELKQATESAAYSTIAGASYSGADVYFGQLNNRLYYCDGVNALKYVDSSLANSAITAGRVTSIKITNQGSGYAAVPTVTFSSGAATATATLGYGGRVIAATITGAGSGYSATTPPGVTFTAAPAAGVTATGRVNISQVPSKPKFLVSHTGRLFCASNDTAIPPDTIYASDFLDGESWDLAGASIRVGGDGDPITGLYPWFDNRLLVFKQRSVWVVDANPLLDPSNWPVELINNRIGCVAHRSIQSVGSDIFFLAQDGVRALSQIEGGAQTSVGLPLSAPIQDEIDTINNAALSKVCSVYYRNRYFLAVPRGSATAADSVLVYNALTKSWCGRWTGWAPRDFTVTGFSGRLRLCFADNTGKFWTWDDFTPESEESISQFRDDTTDYESYVITRAYSHGEPLVEKLGHMVQISTENRLTDAMATMYLSYDRDVSGTFTSNDASITATAGDKQVRRAYNLLAKGKYNVIQFKFGATRWKASLAGIVVTAFPDTIKPQI